MRDDCAVTRNVLLRQDRVLRLAAQRGLSIALLSAETGIPEGTLESYFDRPSRAPSVMSLPNFVKIAAALVAHHHGDLASLLIEDSGCTLAPRDAESANLHAVGAAAAGLAATICTAAADGRFDHREKAAIRDQAGPVLAMLQDVVAGGGPHG